MSVIEVFGDFHLIKTHFVNLLQSFFEKKFDLCFRSLGSQLKKVSETNNEDNVDEDQFVKFTKIRQQTIDAFRVHIEQILHNCMMEFLTDETVEKINYICHSSINCDLSQQLCESLTPIKEDFYSKLVAECDIVTKLIESKEIQSDDLDHQLKCVTENYKKAYNQLLMVKFLSFLKFLRFLIKFLFF